MLIKTVAGRSKSQGEVHFRLSHDRRLFFLELILGLPAVIVSLVLLCTGDFASRVQWTLTAVILTVWLGFVSEIRQRVVFSLQTLSNILAALREGDYSIRGRASRNNDALAEVTREVNTLAQTLREQGVDAVEATALLREVVEEIDVSVFTFDGEEELRVVSRGGEGVVDVLLVRVLGL